MASVENPGMRSVIGGPCLSFAHPLGSSSWADAPGEQADHAGIGAKPSRRAKTAALMGGGRKHLHRRSRRRQKLVLPGWSASYLKCLSAMRQAGETRLRLAIRQRATRSRSGMY